MIINKYNNGGGGSSSSTTYAESAATSLRTELLEGQAGIPENLQDGDVVAIKEVQPTRGAKGTRAVSLETGLYQYFPQRDGWAYTVEGDGAEIRRSGGEIASIALSKSGDTLTVTPESSYITDMPFTIITQDGSECAVQFDMYNSDNVYIYAADMSSYLATIRDQNSWTNVDFYGLSIRCKWNNNQFTVRLRADADAEVWPEGALMFGYGYGSDSFHEYKAEKVDQFATRPMLTRLLREVHTPFLSLANQPLAVSRSVMDFLSKMTEPSQQAEV